MSNADPTEGQGVEQLMVYGKAVMEIVWACYKLNRCKVSDIAPEVLISGDILLCDPSGQANILSSEKRIIFHGHLIPVKIVKQHTKICDNGWKFWHWPNERGYSWNLCR